MLQEDMESFSSEPAASVTRHGGEEPSESLVLNAPEPPSLWVELASGVREAVVPRQKKSSSPLKCIISAIYGLFPILRWGRNYDLKSFRSDLMAGLTLASLGIPQVKS